MLSVELERTMLEFNRTVRTAFAHLLSGNTESPPSPLQQTLSRLMLKAVQLVPAPGNNRTARHVSPLSKEETARRIEFIASHVRWGEKLYWPGRLSNRRDR